MSQWHVAHIRQQGVDLIIVPLDGQFEYKTAQEQQRTISALQAAANSAGLAGTVVPIWRVGNQSRFIAPRPWHPFFKSLSWNQILSSRNKMLTIT